MSGGLLADAGELLGGALMGEVEVVQGGLVGYDLGASSSAGSFEGGFEFALVVVQDHVHTSVGNSFEDCRVGGGGLDDCPGDCEACVVGGRAAWCVTAL